MSNNNSNEPNYQQLVSNVAYHADRKEWEQAERVLREAFAVAAPQGDAPEHHAKTCDRWVQCGDHEHYESIVNCTCAAPPSTQPSARVAAEEIAHEMNGGDRADCSYPPALVALLDNCTIANEKALADWLESIISRHSPSVQPVEEQKFANRTRWLLTQIISDLPAKRDWLDPELEQEARELTGIRSVAALRGSVGEEGK